MKQQAPDFSDNYRNRGSQDHPEAIGAAGLIPGLITTDILSDFGKEFFGESSKLVLLFVEFLIVFVFGLQFYNLIRLTFRKKNW